MFAVLWYIAVAFGSICAARGRKNVGLKVWKLCRWWYSWLSPGWIGGGPGTGLAEVKCDASCLRRSFAPTILSTGLEDRGKEDIGKEIKLVYVENRGNFPVYQRSYERPGAEKVRYMLDALVGDTDQYSS